MTTASNLALLAIQAEGTIDARGCLTGQYGITIACAPGDHALWIGSEVPEPIAAELAEAFAVTVPERDPSARPAAMDRCRQLLESARGVEEQAGPSFVFPDIVPSMTEICVLRCDDRLPESLRSANPGNWLAVEWDELLEGRLGPWTMVRDGDRVVSIGHTPRPLTPRSAECGVWTDPDFRGRGYAAATAAAWAALVRPTGRTLFYSTDADNHSSQRVAERLRLRPIGWTWQLRAPAAEVPSVHPLSALRDRRAATRATRRPTRP